jgi:hypothetical protein
MATARFGRDALFTYLCLQTKDIDEFAELLNY